MIDSTVWVHVLFHPVIVHVFTLVSLTRSDPAGPPSPPRSLRFSLRQSSLVLDWAPPSDSGGRVDLTYSVGCRRCGPTRCEPCGPGVGFVPQQVGLTERTVTVVNLLPNTNYTFSVEALNGVSDLLPSKSFYTQVNVSTSLPRESRSNQNPTRTGTRT